MEPTSAQRKKVVQSPGLCCSTVRMGCDNTRRTQRTPPSKEFIEPLGSQLLATDAPAWHRMWGSFKTRNVGEERVGEKGVTVLTSLLFVS